MKIKHSFILIYGKILSFAICLFIFFPKCEAHFIPHQVHLHKKDCQNYVNFLFWQIKTELGKAIYSGKLPCYRDKDLGKLLSNQEIWNAGELYCEHVRIPIRPNDTTTKDTVICSPFDYTIINQYLIYRSKEKLPNKPEIYSIGLLYEHKGQKVLFYVAFKDIKDYLDNEENDFLNDFFIENFPHASEEVSVSLDSLTMANFAEKELQLLDSKILEGGKGKYLKIYGTDSLELPMRNTDYIQNKDSTTGFIMIYYLTNLEDKIVFDKKGIGILYNPKLNGIHLPERPMFFCRYDEFKQYLQENKNEDFERAFRFCQLAAFFSFHDNWYYDKYWLQGIK